MILNEMNTDLRDKLNQIESFIGNTPLYPIQNVFKKIHVDIYAKLEWQQLGDSVKARAAFNIIKNAIINGDLGNGKRLLDASSGNTGIAYAIICSALGIPVTLCIPENASEERKLILKSLGVEIVYTSRFESTDGAQEKAVELNNEHPERYYYADQYKNENNWKAHYKSTAEEIYRQTQGKISHFVAGLGTTGTFTGTGRRLKELNPDIQLISLQPETALHGMEGWKHLETAHIPEIYDPNVADRTVIVGTVESYDLVKKVAREEGLLISPSAAANLLGAIKVASEIDKGVIVTIFADSLDKYKEIMKSLFT